ncbi:hypothetical protein EYC80_007880 [Monilinia laxa]|uniref:Yippee domain-containing protein n=1 Tax=Monilinia laxa TaxID=61186 RepID=A0A5N6JU76_MONLA|nr:hypothetical protein EYC80_007880 [Monilinia laxa]
MSLEHEVIICYCIKCGLELGSFDNSWEGLGKTYYIPKVTRGIKGFKGVGTIKLANGLAQVGTVIENSALQDLSCTECRQILGLRCDNAPEGHLLKRDQLLLCAKKLRMESQPAGKKAVLHVTKTHDLKKCSNSPSSPLKRPSSILSHATRPRDVSHQSIEQSFTPAVSLPPTPGDAALTSTIHEQRKDIDRIDAAVGRLQKDIQDVKFFMEDFRREMTEIRNTRPVAESMIDNLRADVLHLGDKATEVDDIRSQLQSLRTRISNIEEASRNTGILKSRVDNTPTASAEQQNVQMLRKPVTRERGHTRDLTIAESYKASRRKRRYSEAESNQMESKVSNITNLKQHKRKRQPGFRQDEVLESRSSSPIRLSNEEAATPSQYRIESPILGRYNNDDDNTQQDNDQDMEHDTGLQIPESPSQQIATEMHTPNETHNNEQCQCLRDISRNTTNKIPESSRGTSPSQPSKISPEISGGYPFTSHLNLPHIQYQSPYVQPEIPDSQQLEPAQIQNQSQYQSPRLQSLAQYQSLDQRLQIPDSSQPFQEIQEQELPILTRRSRGRPKGSKNIFSPLPPSFIIDYSSDILAGPGRALRRRTIPILGSDSAVRPLVAEVTGTSRNDTTIELTGYEEDVTGEFQEDGRSRIAQVEGQGKGEKSTLAQEAEEEAMSHFMNSTKSTRRRTRSSHNGPIVDLSGEENVSGNLEVAGTSPLVQVEIQVPDTHSALTEDDIEDTSQDLRPRKRPRRNTRSSHRRHSVNLDAAIPSGTTAITDVSTVDNEYTEKQPRRRRISIGVPKGITSDEDGDHADVYTERIKNQQSDRDYAWEEERERGRAKYQGIEQEKRRRSTRRKELERREELVKAALGLERDY